MRMTYSHVCVKKQLAPLVTIALRNPTLSIHLSDISLMEEIEEIADMLDMYE
jgi:hypothetical protein